MVVMPSRRSLPIDWTGNRRPVRSRPRLGIAPNSTQSGAGWLSGSAIRTPLYYLHRLRLPIFHIRVRCRSFMRRNTGVPASLIHDLRCTAVLNMIPGPKNQYWRSAATGRKACLGDKRSPTSGTSKRTGSTWRGISTRSEIAEKQRNLGGERAELEKVRTKVRTEQGQSRSGIGQKWLWFQ